MLRRGDIQPGELLEVQSPHGEADVSFAARVEAVRCEWLEEGEDPGVRSEVARENVVRVAEYGPDAQLPVTGYQLPHVAVPVASRLRFTTLNCEHDRWPCMVCA